MLFIQDMLGMCGLYSLRKAPRTGNRKPQPLFGERKERYSKGRILRLNLQLTSVPSKIPSLVTEQPLSLLSNLDMILFHHYLQLICKYPLSNDEKL